MTENETTKNTLYQLEEKMNREHWGDIQLFEDEDSRYSIAAGKAILLIKELEQYKAIGTVEELKALKEKNEPKKPEPIEYEKYMDVLENAKFLRGAYWCPNCKHTVRSGAYCDDCGQKLDWKLEQKESDYER